MAKAKKVVDETQTETEDGKQELMDKILNSETPSYCSKEWPAYVLSQFAEEELDNGNPNVHGLRRVAEDLLGSFIASGPIEVKSSLDGDSTGRAYCIYEIVVYPFMRGSDQPAVDNGFEKRVYRAAADSYIGNTDDKFAVYPTAMAEVRAEARCLRKMLKLNKVSAEELTSKNAEETINKEQSKKIEATFEVDDAIATSQVFLIKDRCKMLGIDYMKLINSGEKQYESIEQVTKGTAAKIIQRVTQYQNNSVPIPPELI